MALLELGWNGTTLLGNPALQPYYRAKRIWDYFDEEEETSTSGSRQFRTRY